MGGYIFACWEVDLFSRNAATNGWFSFGFSDFHATFQLMDALACKNSSDGWSDVQVLK